jgi:hypothetical protein
MARREVNIRSELLWRKVTIRRDYVGLMSSRNAEKGIITLNSVDQPEVNHGCAVSITKTAERTSPVARC